MKGSTWVGIALVLALGQPVWQPASSGAGEKRKISVLMADTMTLDLADALKETIESKFATLSNEFTGLDGTLAVRGDIFEIAQKLDAKKADLAVFQGVEFAWVKLKHPDFKPLMVAINQHKFGQAQLFVHKKSGIDDFKDLQGKELAVPKKVKEHCRLFLERIAREAGGDPKSVFKAIHNPSGSEDALDSLVSGKVQAVLVDKTGGDFYEYLKPGAYAQLKLLRASELFPPTVLVYKEGAVDAKLLDTFRTGLIKANKSERGQEVMSTFNMTSFEPVPDDFAKTLEAIRKVYPKPRKTGK